MEQATLLSAHAQARRMYNLLNEVLDVSRQLTEAVDREDQISIKMLLNMRSEPLENLQKVRRTLEQQVIDLPQEDRERLATLLNGGEARAEAEAGLAAQVGANNRLLRQVVEIDERINRKMAREQSVYRN
jgi:cell division FtsZ-interacting protein ZapD